MPEPYSLKTEQSFDFFILNTQIRRTIYVQVVKLAVLKFYQVDGDGKVTRSRKDCPNCGAGVRLAVHKDRFHCGKCSNTYMIEN